MSIHQQGQTSFLRPKMSEALSHLVRNGIGKSPTVLGRMYIIVKTPMSYLDLVMKRLLSTQFEQKKSPVWGTTC